MHIRSEFITHREAIDIAYGPIFGISRKGVTTPLITQRSAALTEADALAMLNEPYAFMWYQEVKARIGYGGRAVYCFGIDRKVPVLKITMQGNYARPGAGAWLYSAWLHSLDGFEGVRSSKKRRDVEVFGANVLVWARALHRPARGMDRCNALGTCVCDKGDARPSDTLGFSPDDFAHSPICVANAFGAGIRRVHELFWDLTDGERRELANGFRAVSEDFSERLLVNPAGATAALASVPIGIFR